MSSVIMQYGICLQSFVPVRYSQSEKSEMISQLLFGETYTIIEQGLNWIKIRCSYDNYTGWIDLINSHGISEESFISINQSQQNTLDGRMVQLTLENKTCMTIVAGSDLPFYHPDRNGFEIDNIAFRFNEKPETGREKASVESVIKTAKAFFNVPYLWGGRSLFGIDCSGLTQVVFKINHIKIPRDTSQQVLSGKPVDRFEDAQQGDLVFLRNDKGKICHVGILMTQNQILHASGHVRMDQLDPKGIFNTEKQQYTHRFDCIRRLI